MSVSSANLLTTVDLQEMLQALQISYSTNEDLQARAFQATYQACKEKKWQLLSPFTSKLNKLVDKMGRSLLAYASEEGDRELVSELQKRGIGVNTTNNTFFHSVRNKTLWTSPFIKKNTPFTVEEASLLFSNILRGYALSESAALIKEFECYPVALHQAAHYIRETAGMTIPKYRSLLDEQKVPQLDQKPFSSIYSYTAVSTWNITFNRLQERNPDALKWLVLCSYLYPMHIPISWMRYWLQQRNSARDSSLIERNVEAILQLLKSYHLISIESDYLSMHGIVQDILKVNFVGEKRSVLQTLAQVVDGGLSTTTIELPANQKYLHTWSAHATAFISHCEGQLITPSTAKIMYHLSVWYKLSGNYMLAREYAEKALTACEQLYPNVSHRHTARVLEQLGTITVRDTQQALLYSARALAMFQDLQNTEPHQNILQHILGLLFVIGMAKRLQDATLAKIYFMEAHKITKQLVADRPQLAPELPVLNNLLAQLERFLDDSNGSQAMIDPYTQMLTVARIYYGNQFHPHIIRALNILGRLHSVQGNNKKAGEYYSEALDMQTAANCLVCSDLVESLLGVANYLKDSEQCGEANSLYLEAVDACKKLYGEEAHTLFADALVGAGEACVVQGNGGQSLIYFEQAIKMRRKLTEGKPDLRMAWALFRYGIASCSLAQSSNEAGLYQLVCQNFNEAIKMYRTLQGDKPHLMIAISFQDLAVASIGLDKPQQTVTDYFTRSLDIFTQLYGDAPQELIAELLTKWGCYFLLKQDLQNSRLRLQQARAMYEKLNPDHPSIQELNKLLAYIDGLPHDASPKPENDG